MIKEEATIDAECISLTNQIQQGFPHAREELPAVLRPYWTMKDNLYVVDNVPFKENKMLIPMMLKAQSNGRAEAAVKTAKRILLGNINAVTGRLDTYEATKALMTQRNTPAQGTEISPAIALFGRPIRDHLPTQHLRREWQTIADSREKALAEHHLSSPIIRQFDPLAVGDAVQLQNQTGNHPTK